MKIKSILGILLSLCLLIAPAAAAGGDGTMYQTSTPISLWFTTNTDLTIDAMANDNSDEEPNIFGE